MFYKETEEIEAIQLQLKQTVCPHCKLVGFLILHGYLRGYAEKDANKKVIRGRRVFCSNRRCRKGCGRTISFVFIDVIKRFTLKAGSLWIFLKAVLEKNSRKRAFEATGLPFRITTAYRIWNKLQAVQPYLRTKLEQICAPPRMEGIAEPLLQTIKHLLVAFSGTDCPVSAFQQRFQASIFNT